MGAYLDAAVVAQDQAPVDARERVIVFVLMAGLPAKVHWIEPVPVVPAAPATVKVVQRVLTAKLI